MASRISADKAFHRFTFDCPSPLAIAFDEACIAANKKWSQRMRELMEADVAAASSGDKKKGKK